VKAQEIIMTCLEEKGISQRQLAMSMDEDVRLLNQQLNHRNDMKFDRFRSVLEALGYEIEIFDNGGIRRVAPGYAKEIIEKRVPTGAFWCYEDGAFIGIDNRSGDAFCEDFKSKEACFAWLNDAEK